MVEVGVPDITCHFSSGRIASATCTIQYGIDPTYMNLTNVDSFTGTNVSSVTVSLSASLQAETLYYYVVSSMGVRMQGTFQRGTSVSLASISLNVIGTCVDQDHCQKSIYKKKLREF